MVLPLGTNQAFHTEAGTVTTGRLAIMTEPVQGERPDSKEVTLPGSAQSPAQSLKSLSSAGMLVLSVTPGSNALLLAVTVQPI